MDRWFTWRESRDLVRGFYVGAFSVSLAVVSALWLVSALIVGTVVIADWIAGAFR